MKTVRLPSDNPDGLIALGPFLAGKLYEVPDDVAPMLDVRIKPDKVRKNEKGEALESVTPTTAAHDEVFAHLRAQASPPKPADEPAPAEAEPAKPAKAATQVSN